MLKYTIINKSPDTRVIIVKSDDLARYTLLDASGTPIAFKRMGGQAVAMVSGTVDIYKKPNVLQIHKEYMLHNARSLWLGFSPDFSRLASNMSEFEGTI